MKGLKTDTFLFGQALIDFLKFHLEREVLSLSKFVERWFRVAIMGLLSVCASRPEKALTLGGQGNVGSVGFLDWP